METMENILNKFKEFNTYLNGINLEQMSQSYSRKELEEFANSLRSIELRSLTYDLSKLTKAMKLKEFPELKGVHHYPELRKIDFLSEDEKVKLDNHLVRFRVGNMIAQFYEVTYDEGKVQKIIEFLLECGIVEQEFYVMCPRCGIEQISDRLTDDDKARLDRAIADKEQDNREEILDEYINYYCEECGDDVYPGHKTELTYRPVIILKKECDKSLDNV